MKKVDITELKSVITNPTIPEGQKTKHNQISKQLAAEIVTGNSKPAGAC